MLLRSDGAFCRVSEPFGMPDEQESRTGFSRIFRDILWLARHE